ncbi:MAG: 3-oxoacyl-[acyl-carrier-protein] synthase III C-terminal domain-containing protein [Myxococcota bacterium]|nr:3-oxoacyl-[acyl-carrier-protein] synthase III C-terminal domain-containing protein [Myxococcota bacterium]
MQIAAVGHAFPDNYYDQDALIAKLMEVWGQRHHNLSRLERIHRNVLVGGRHLALPLDAYEDLRGFGDANDAWISVAVELGERAIRRALEASGVPAEKVGAIIFTSVTGIATPSIEARIMNRIPELPRHLKRIPMFGLGCVAGAAGVARAADYVKAWPDQVALLLSVELCSLTIQRQDLSIPNLISSGLFGDGAACAVVCGEQVSPGNSEGPRVLGTRSVFYSDTERVMGWDIGSEGFKIVLSADVPQMVTDNLRGDVDAFLEAHGLSLDDIGSFVCHPGGPKVLLAFESALERPREAFQLTWDSLQQVGNLSSSSVLLVLQETMKPEHRPPAGSLGLMLAMGPAFCSELVLLQW